MITQSRTSFAATGTLLLVFALGFAKFAAAGPENSSPGQEVDAHSFSAEDRAWWAIQPVVDPAVPSTGKSWARNDIDPFIAGALAKAGLEPAPEADRRELVRRAYYDLHGLPPTPDQIAAFLTDKRPDAWERLIDELLASPRYGERWGQHWLDVVRWAESDGYNQDAFRPDAWPYRDYVIKSFNQDKPYDRFVREQLAGDEIDPNDPDVLIGTAFLRNGLYEYNQRNVRMHWDLIVNELTRVTSEAFLGLGLGCAQCHDHKFDPLLQKDYFAMQAFLAPVSWRHDLQLATPEEKKIYAAELAKWEKATAGIRAGIDAILEPKIVAKQENNRIMFPPDIQEMFAKKEAERTPFEQQLVELAEIQVHYERERFDEKKSVTGAEKEKLDTLRAELKKFDSIKPSPLPRAFVATDIRREAPKVLLTKRSGDEEIEPAFLTLLDPGKPVIRPTAVSSGRRLALADWITRNDNPFSTRVIVNRIWQRHFGVGIVPTPNDFGTLGEKPSHPELLDWLTSRFLESGWKMKPIHRLVMNSATYRQTARREPAQAESVADPGNRLLWRFPPRRLDAEELRDAMLLASGELQQREGGPSAEGTSPVRSIFVKKSRNRPDEILSSFDSPLGFESAAERIATTTPTQSLLLVNGEWSAARARALATRLLAGKSQIDPAPLREAIRIAYGREPGPDELDAGVKFVNAQHEDSSLPAEVPDKFPGETGLRPVSQLFKAVRDTGLGDKSLWLQPGSRFEKLHLEDLDLSEDRFTIETVTVLDNIHRDASVNTLASRWNGNQQSPGWTFGVTSEKSNFQPRNLIVQLIGRDFQDVTIYEVVASGLSVPIGKPVYLAASISAAAAPDDPTAGSVTFYMKDLSDPKAPLQKRVVKHSIVRGIQSPTTRTFVSGRDQDDAAHLWDGQLARISVSPGALSDEQLITGARSGEAKRLIDWTFSGEDGEQPAPGTAWIRTSAPARDESGIPPRLLAAMTDYCHTLLISNEFLYLH